MKFLKLTNAQEISITINKISPNLMSGFFEINTSKISVPYEINCYFNKVSDSLYDLFFNINWSEDNSTNLGYTVFTGELSLSKSNKAELNLNWFFVDHSKQSESCRIGNCKLSNYSINKTNNKFQNIPYPKNL